MSGKEYHFVALAWKGVIWTVADQNQSDMIATPVVIKSTGHNSWVGSEKPCRAELPSADLHNIFFKFILGEDFS